MPQNYPILRGALRPEYAEAADDVVETVVAELYGPGVSAAEAEEFLGGIGRAFGDFGRGVANVAYEKYDFGQGYDADGYSAEAGVRAALAPKFEGYAMLGYEDGNDFDGDAYGRLGGTVKFNQTWGINADVKFADGDRQWFVGPRISF